MYCSNCGKELPDGTKFCRYCGQQQEDLIIAPPPEKKPKKTLKIILIAAAFLIVILAAVLITPFCMQKFNQKQYDMKIAAGQRYLDEMDYEQAVIAYQAAIKIDPRNLEAYIELSDAYLGLDDSESAARILERAVDIVTSGYEGREDIIGDSGAVITKLAEIRMEDKDFSEARDLYEIGKKYLPERDWESEEETLTENERELYQKYIVETLIPAYGTAKLDKSIYDSYVWQENMWDPSPFTGIVSIVIDDLNKDSSLDMAVVLSRADEKTGGDGTYTYSDKSFDLCLYQLEHGAVAEKHILKDVGTLEDQCFGYIAVMNYTNGDDRYLCIKTGADTNMEYAYNEIRVYQVIGSRFQLQTGFRHNYSESEHLVELKDSGEPVNLRFITHWGTVDSDGRDLSSDTGNTGEYTSMTEAMSYAEQTLEQYGALIYWNNMNADMMADTPYLLGAYTTIKEDVSSYPNYIVKVYDNSDLRSLLEKSRLDRLKASTSGPAYITESKITNVLKNDAGNDICYIDISYPQITPAKGLDGAGKINEFFETTNKKISDDMITSVTSDNEEYDIPYPYEQSSSYSVGLNTGKVLGICVDSYDYYGGVHGYEALLYYNFDMFTGLSLSLSDIAVDSSQFQSFLKQEILNQIWANNDQEALFPEYQTTLQNYDLNTNWLLDETGFTFVFNAYELGSYASGGFTYTVPYETCTPYLNQYGKAITSK